MVYINYASKIPIFEIDFNQQNINKSQKIIKMFQFALFVKKGGIILTIIGIFLYLCSHEKELNNRITISAHNIQL